MATKALITSLLISLQFIALVMYVIASESYLYWVYWISQSINVFVTFLLLARSIFIQRRRLTKFEINNGTMQSQITNVTLIFMVAVYFALLGCLLFFDHYQVSVVYSRILDFVAVVIFFMVAAHFIGDLE